MTQPSSVAIPVTRQSISIRQEDLIQSVADALQYISYYHPVDYIKSLAAAYALEQSPAAKDAIAQILINSRMCAEGHRPICQDTGIVTVFLEIGMDVRWDDATMGVEDMVHEGVRRAYNHPIHVTPGGADIRNTRIHDVEVIDRILYGVDRDGNLRLLEDLCETMAEGSLCGLGGLTPFPVRSALRHFKDDFLKPPMR